MDVTRSLPGALRRYGAVFGVVVGVGAGWGLSSINRPRAAAPLPASPTGRTAEERRVAMGRELFHREWTPGDPRARGGDGLGPVYNESSCVACHNLGGSGGGGPVNKNVDLVTSLEKMRQSTKATGPAVGPRRAGNSRALELLFAKAPSVVLHRFGTEPGFAACRLEMLGALERLGPRSRDHVPVDSPIELARAELASSRLDTSGSAVGSPDFTRNQRNASALLGIGPIDGISEAAIVAAARRRFPAFPEVTGRVSRIKGGAIGRFGWKAQMATLDDFVRTACSVELGLEVPGHAQAANPVDPGRAAPGLDLNDSDCDALADYIRSLPPPAEAVADAEAMRVGRETFAAVGCATCHMPDLGPSRGIYSDLLLHDMGTELADSASYNGVLIEPPVGDGATPEGATALEWRTPPLWGVRDSAPYLHDGRAETLEQAVAFHGGEAKAITDRFFGLPPTGRRRVLVFLNTLGAPASPAPMQVVRTGD
jgi:CxxC motif-containing protein (DUF1111 family)